MASARARPAAIRQHGRPLAFLAAAVSSYAVALVWVLPALDTLPRAELVATALTVDLALVVPLLYLLLLVRGRGWPWLTAVPVLVLSLAAAGAVLPDRHQGLLRLLELAVAPGELLLIAHLVRRAWRALGGRRRDADLFDTLRRSAHRTLGVPWVAEVLAFETAVVFYAFFTWRARPHHGGARQVFDHVKRAHYGPFLAAMMVLMVLEIVPIHLLLHRLSPLAAWALSALSLYGLVWLYGDYRALRLRPSLLHDDAFELRLGLRWNARLERAAIRRLRRLAPGTVPARRSGYLPAVVAGTPRQVIELRSPIVVRGPYGWRKRVDAIGVAVDDEAALERALGGA